jgi:hypothetical protein
MKFPALPPPYGTPLNRSHSLAQGLVYNALLNEGGGNIIKDSTRFNPIDGALTNGPVFQQSQLGQCILFDAVNDYIPLLKNSVFTFPVSISFWFKLSTTTLAGDAIFVAINNPASLDEFWVGWIAGAPTALRMLTQSTGGANARSETSFLAKDLLWHHCVAVFTDNVTQNIYTDAKNTNGSNVNTGAGTAAPTGLTTISIGGFIYNTSNFYSTSIARSIQNVMIWNRSLSPTEVRQLYTNPYAMFKSKRP